MRALVLGLAGVLAVAQTFEVATVKSSPPPTGNLFNINLGTVRNGKVTFANASLSDCLKFAYGIVSDEQISGPDWITSKAVRFDIVAQAAPGVEREQLELMVQSLLAERLKLVVHHEQKRLSFLALVPGKNGSKLHAATSPTDDNLTARGRVNGAHMSMKLLATLLSRFEREIVVDQTGLTGPFEVKLEWTPDDGDGPSIYTALQQQLGLRLESRKGPLDVLVVDHAEKVPTDN